MLFIKLLSIIISAACLFILPIGTLNVDAEMNSLENEIQYITIVEELNKASLIRNSLSGNILYEGMRTINYMDLMDEELDSIHLTRIEPVQALSEEIQVKEIQLEEVTYNPENLREPSNLSKEQIFDILEGSNLQVLSNHYYEMEKKYNVNAVFLMALNSEESGHGTSMLARNNNNIGGVKTIDGGWAIFESWEDSLEFIASLIDTKYLTETGPYYNGTSIYDVNVRYCEGTQWALNLNAIAYEFMDRVEFNS